LLLGLLDTQDGPADLAEAYRGNWAGLFDLLQQLYPNGRYSDAAAKALKQDAYLLPGGMFLPRPDKTAAQLNEWYGRILILLEAPLSLDVYRELRAKTDRRNFERVAKKNLFLSVYVGSGNTLYKLAMAVDTERRGITALVALHVFHAEHGRWPDSLRDVALSSDTLRIDPFSGRDFVYEVKDGQPYLYSVGLDGADNGGKHDRRACTREREEGYDYVFLPVQPDG
jgi:hypothetical protein